MDVEPESLNQAHYTTFHLFPGQTQTKPANITFVGDSISSIPTMLLVTGCINNLTAGQHE